MNPQEFQRLTEWIATHTGTSEDEAGAAAAGIGDLVPQVDSAGNWLITVAGKAFAIPPFD
ncbi:MAG: hypothetical protein V4726_11100 [Verrucomicrobiota bacterium]